MAVTTPLDPGARLERGFGSFISGDSIRTTVRSGSAGRLGQRAMRHGFDPDTLRETLVETESGVANLTKDIGLQTDELHLAILAETHFTESLVDLRGRVQLANDYHGASAGAAQWMETRTSGLHGQGMSRHGIIHATGRVGTRGRGGK